MVIACNVPTQAANAAAAMDNQKQYFPADTLHAEKKRQMRLK